MKLLNARKKLVTLAVASAISGGVMMSAPAQAMNVSQNNVGEVLLFPYYTVKNGFDTVFTVTNTTDKTAVFKIRFREALNSREVRDFNVILSPYDHWGAAVTLPDGTSTPVVRTFDKTCTSPLLPASATMAGATEVGFTNALYSGIYEDGADTSIERSQEGYFEVILMGLSSRSTSTSTNLIEYNAKHVDGVPRNCSVVDQQFLDVAGLVKPYFYTPENVLKGHVTYIDVDSGKAIDAEPTAIENFFDNLAANVDDDIIAAPGDVNPDLADGDTGATANLINNGTPVAAGGDLFRPSQNTLSMLLMANSVVNEFATGTGAATSWVVTFPTKHHFTDAYTAAGTVDQAEDTALPPFSDWFSENVAGDGTSCDNIGMFLASREEDLVISVDNTQFSPYNPTTQTVELCYEANVVNFNSSNVFGSGTNRLTVDTTGLGAARGSSGWAKLTFTEADATTPVVAMGNFTGLPVIGFAAIMRDQGAASVNYGSSEEHTYMSTNFGAN
jgi:hypothetical protein